MEIRTPAWVLSALTTLLLAACPRPDTFACAGDTECPNGRCEADGFCSFPTESCDSGWQYGEFSGPLAGQCVPADAGTESGGMTSTGSGSTTAPTTLGTTSSDAETTDSDDPTSGCNSDEVCLAIPPGWSGPVTLAPSGTCDAGVEFSGATSYDGPHTCECECEVEAVGTCDQLTVTLEFFNDTECDGAPQLALELTPGCEQLGSPTQFYIRAVAEGAASCEPELDFIGEPIVGIDPQDACTMAAGAPCPGGACADGGAPQCIYAEGERECPDSFTTRTVLFGDFADERDCGPCGCDGSYVCSGDIEVATSPNGCEVGGSSLPIGECSNAPTSVYGAGITNIDGMPTPSCQSSGGEPIGTVEATAPITACCTG